MIERHGPEGLRDIFAPVGALVAAFLLDQTAKTAAFAWVGSNGDWELAPFLSVTTGWNTGIAFSVARVSSPIVLVVVAFAICATFTVMLIRSRQILHRVGYGLIIGGAISNVLDRLIFGAVRDFIDVHWQSWHWPTFNLADTAILIGVLMLLTPARMRASR